MYVLLKITADGLSIAQGTTLPKAADLQPTDYNGAFSTIKRVINDPQDSNTERSIDPVEPERDETSPELSD